ncbi:cell wall-binding repeat-containing protein [Clostridioides difficile]
MLGGTSSISDSVLNDLKSKGLAVDRIGGNDRQDTSLKIAKKLNDTNKIDKVDITDRYKGLVDASSVSAPAT